MYSQAPQIHFAHASVRQKCPKKGKLVVTDVSFLSETGMQQPGTDVLKGLASTGTGRYSMELFSRIKLKTQCKNETQQVKLNSIQL